MFVNVSVPFLSVKTGFCRPQRAKCSARKEHGHDAEGGAQAGGVGDRGTARVISDAAAAAGSGATMIGFSARTGRGASAGVGTRAGGGFAFARGA